MHLQLNLTLRPPWGQKCGRCTGVETRVNVWTVRQNKMAVVERWPLVEVSLYHLPSRGGRAQFLARIFVSPQQAGVGSLSQYVKFIEGHF